MKSLRVAAWAFVTIFLLYGLFSRPQEKDIDDVSVHVFSFLVIGVIGLKHHIIKYKKGKQNDGKKIERTDGGTVSSVSTFCRFAAARATQQAALQAAAD